MILQRPVVSRKPLVLLVSLCLLVAAAAIPAASHLPAWIEVEFVLLAWWAVCAAVLTYLLYIGHGVDDDIIAPSFSGTKSDALYHSLEIAANCGGCVVGENCLAALMILFAGLLIGLALALLIELVIPAIALLLLVSIGGMLARVANDTHGCHNRFGPSLFWGVLWATIYVAPIAAIVVWVAAIAKHS